MSIRKSRLTVLSSASQKMWDATTNATTILGQCRKNGTHPLLAMLLAGLSLFFAPVATIYAADDFPTIADFDSGPPAGFFVFNGGGSSVTTSTPTIVAGDPLALPGQTAGNGVLQVDFNIGDFGGFGANFGDTPQDWSDYDGLAFWFHGTGSGLVYQAEFFDNGVNADGAERWDYEFTDTVAGWRYINIPFSQFTRATDFQPGGAPDDGLTLTQMWGWAVPLPAGSDIVYFDQIELVNYVTFADFEGAVPPDFFVFNGGASSVNTAVQTVADSDALALPTQSGDNGILQTDFNIGDFGGFGANFFAQGPQDWSNLDGISFWFYGSNSGLSYQFELQDNRSDPANDTAERFDYNFTDDFAGWQLISIPFSQFVRATDFQPDGAPNDGLTLTEVWGWAFVLPAGSSIFYIDDVSAYGDVGNVTIKVSFDAADYGVVEGDTATITVALTAAAADEVTVMYATADDTAIAGTDYTATSGTLTFPAGVTEQTFTVATQDNTARDGDRSLTLTLAGSVNAELGVFTQAALKIQDNEEAMPGNVDIIVDFEDGAPTGTDPNNVPVGFFIAEDGNSTTAFTTTDVLPADVPGVPAPNNVLQMDFDVAVFGVVIHNFTNDAVNDWVPQDWTSYEAFSFWLYGNNSDTDLFVDIIDNRNPGSIVDDAERFTYTFKDDFSGWKYIEIPFSELTRKEIGNGAPNDGFTQTEVHGWAFGTLTTNPAQTYYIDQVGLVVRETIVDDFESGLAAGNDGNGVPIGFFNAQDGGSTVSFGESTTPPAEVPGQGAGNTVLQMDFNVSAFGVVIHNFENAALDTWVSQDWSSYEGLAFWLYGQNTGTDLFVDVIDNRNPGSTSDDAERFTVAFKDDFSGWKYFEFRFADFARKDIGNGAPNDGFTLTEIYGWAFGTLATSGPVTYYLDNVTIFGNTGSDRPLEIGYGANSFNVDEGETATISVKLTRAAEEEIRVDYATTDRSDRTATEEDSATADRDYLATNGTLVFPPGVTEQTFTVETLDDGKHEVDETVILILSNPVNVEFGFVDDATLSIKDNDPLDPALIDDFELFPYMVDTMGNVNIDTSEIAQGTADALPGQGRYEKVLDVTYDTTEGMGRFGRNFPEGEDWSSYDGMSVWVFGTGSGATLTMEVLDNRAADPGPDGWEMVWSDEFDATVGTPPNPDTWTQETGGWGWGNSEFPVLHRGERSPRWRRQHGYHCPRNRPRNYRA